MLRGGQSSRHGTYLDDLLESDTSSGSDSSSAETLKDKEPPCVKQTQLPFRASPAGASALPLNDTEHATHACEPLFEACASISHTQQSSPSSVAENESEELVGDTEQLLRERSTLVDDIKRQLHKSDAAAARANVQSICPKGEHQRMGNCSVNSRSKEDRFREQGVPSSCETVQGSGAEGVSAGEFRWHRRLPEDVTQDNMALQIAEHQEAILKAYKSSLANSTEGSHKWRLFQVSHGHIDVIFSGNARFR